MNMSKPTRRTTLCDLTSQLLASYQTIGGINHVDGKSLPSKATIANVIQDLLRLLFPGFFGDRTVRSLDLELETTALLASVQGQLEGEMRSSFEYAPPDGTERDNLALLAQEVTTATLAELPRVRELLQTDAEAAFGGDPAALSPDEVIVAYPFIEAIAVQRFAHELYKRNVPLIPRIMTEWAHARTGLDIHPGAEIGSHFFVDHCTGTVIGETSTIGSHVKMYQGVGLVARSLSGGQALRGKKRHPTIGDRVTIYANATIVGGETVVGSGSTLGASVFIMESIPPNSLVVWEPSGVRTMAKMRSAETPDYQI
jgi:serine O-acetyltransferase